MYDNHFNTTLVQISFDLYDRFAYFVFLCQISASCRICHLSQNERRVMEGGHGFVSSHAQTHLSLAAGLGLDPRADFHADFIPNFLATSPNK